MSYKPAKGLSVRLVTLFTILFLTSPLLIIILYSFNSSPQVTSWGGFSLKWYEKIFSDGSMWSAIKNSILIALGNTFISTVLGTLGAFALARFNFKYKNALQSLIYIPVVLPEIIFGIALLSFFMMIKLPLGFFTVLISHVTFSLSFAILIIYARLSSFDFRMMEASLDLGANRITTFFRVVLPNISTGILSAAIFVFTLSIDDFVITFFTSGTGTTTLPLKIYSMLKFAVTPEINAISTLIILFTLGAIALAYFFQKIKIRSQKLIVFISLIPIVFILGLFLISARLSAKEELNIFIWTEYLDEKILSEFESETGVKININYYSNNEELLAKLQMGFSGYDLIFPSDYMVEIMKNEGLISQIDTTFIPNYSFIDPEFKRLSYDTTGSYYIPYAYGFMGIVYNKKFVKEPVTSWKIFWDPAYKGKMMLLNDMREVFMVAYKILGYDGNTINPDELQKALNILQEQKPLLFKYESAVTTEYMASREAWLAHTDVGTALKLMRNNPDFGFSFPDEGTHLFMDNICIPKTAPNRANALKFINFLLRPEITARNIKHVMYPMPNIGAKDFLPDSLRNNKLLFPDRKSTAGFELMKDLGSFNEQMDLAWTKLMNY